MTKHANPQVESNTDIESKNTDVVDENPEPTKPQTNTDKATTKSKEFGGPSGLEPTRYGDWEKNGRCTDF